MNVENWNWAVWVVVALYAFNFLMVPVLHGRDRDPWNGPTMIFGMAIGASLLYFGGFFA